MVLRLHSTAFCCLCQEKSVPKAIKSIIPLDICVFISKISCMKQAFFFVALSGMAACVAAADDVSSMCDKLTSGLDAQLSILSSIQDAQSAAAHVAELQENFDALKVLSDSMDGEGDACKTTELWRYIDSSPEIKPRLVRCVQQISIHFHRIESAEFYGCEPLKNLLTPLLVPASARPEEAEQ